MIGICGGLVSLSFSESVWVTVAAYFRSVKIFGGYPIPFPLGIYVPESVDVVLPTELSPSIFA